MEIIFNFGGFYESLFNGKIEDAIEMFGYEPKEIDNSKTFKSVAKDIVNVFNEYLDNEFDIDVDLEFVSLESPRYYNYTTDKIVLEVSDKDLKTLNDLLSDEYIFEEFKTILKDKTTRRSGFMPFYSYHGVMAKIDEENTAVFYQVLLDTLISNEVGEDYNDYMFENLKADECLEFID